jgi:MoaA/NifB/PqqE/SkfB family radical SAM enzyme
MKSIPIIPDKTFPTKNFQGKYCLSPFKSIEIDIRGDVGLCLCTDWMPQKIGNILEHKLSDILSSPLAQKVRQSITNGTFEYCNEVTCGVIQNDQLVEFDRLSEHDQNLVSDTILYQMPSDIFLALDQTCNLSCPSCRTKVIKPNADQIVLQQNIGNTLYNNLFSTPTDKEINLRLSSSGEVFASPSLLKFLQRINTGNFPNINIWIQTNGLLAPTRWQQLQHIEKNIRNITITVDANSGPTYEKLRRGGKWPDLLDAMTFLKEKKQSLGFELQTRMVVQADNFHEIQSFYTFSKQFDADIVDYTRIGDWKVYSPEEFASVDVFNQSHPMYHDAKQLLDEVLLNPDVILSGGL